MWWKSTEVSLISIFVFGKKKIGPAWHMNNFLFNFQFFVKHLGKSKKGIIEKAKAYIVVLEDTNIEIPDDFYKSLKMT